MRIVVCDYSGHPFQMQLSRELAKRGNEVLHLHFAEFQTPKGRLQVEPGDSPTLCVEAVSLGRPFSKHKFVRRRFEEVEVGRRIARRIGLFDPEIVVGCNLPLDSLDQVARAAIRDERVFVFWQQDIYSFAIRKILAGKYGLPGDLIGRYYRSLERRTLLASDAVVVISDDFPHAIRDGFGIAGDNIHVIENWAPLDEITPRPRDNGWTRAQGLAGREVVLYTGTLGMKHDPAQLLALARALLRRRDAVLVVTSEGPAAEWLAREGAALSTLRVLPFQPYASYPEVLGSADVLLSVLEADAGIYSVPSKVLSYLCAGRAIVLSAPANNLAVRLVQSSGAGRATIPGRHDDLVAAVFGLLDDVALRTSCARQARAYAERTFDIGMIANRFEHIFRAAMMPKLSPQPAFESPAAS